MPTSPAPRTALALLAAALLLCPPAPGAAQELPRSSLAVWSGGAWRTWWRSDRAPGAWREPHPTVAAAVEWRPAGPGVEWGELRLAGDGEAWRLRTVLVRMDPRHLRLALVSAARAGGRRGAWTVDSVPAQAVLGVNAGQFSGGTPWGWVVRDGREVQPPGHGPLSTAVVVDTAGRVRLVEPGELPAVRAAGGVAHAFQSYPSVLVEEGRVPAALSAPGRGVDVGHRDGRLAFCELRDGRVLLALTRWEGLGGVLEVLPFGLTVPEMAALAGALGCRRAVLLDGGISGQLLLRTAQGGEQAWRGLRRVPLGLLAFPAAAPAAGSPSRTGMRRR